MLFRDTIVVHPESHKKPFKTLRGKKSRVSFTVGDTCRQGQLY